MNILTVVGARPQFVKAAPLGRAFAGLGITHELIHTGQHWDFAMSEVFFRELGISPPVVNLGVGAGSHGRQTGEMLAKLEDEFVMRRPDWVVVLGDTNSTLAGALAAAKLHIPVAHVEAGLRSFNRSMPEEVNRVLVDHLSDLLFTPTTLAVENLVREGIDERRVKRVGDVMYDAFVLFSPLARSASHIASELGLENGAYILATIHRAENTDNIPRLKSILASLQIIARTCPVVLPLHPRTRAALANAAMSAESLSPIRLTEPLSYFDMLTVESRAAVIVTDSGGVQKEAFFSRIPCVTVRKETEWTELVHSGWNKLCPPGDIGALVSAVLGSVGRVGESVELYGGGESAVAIARTFNGEQ